MTKPESPTVIATRLGLGWRKGRSATTLTWDGLLDLAARAYWERRNSGRGQVDGEAPAPRPVQDTRGIA